MPEFNCGVCRRDWSIAKGDLGFYESHGWECNLCYSLIAKKRYEVNIKGATTIFSPMGGGLGDRLMGEVIKRRYLIDNPDEQVIFCDNPIEAKKLYETAKYQKLFWADTTLPIVLNDIQQKFLTPPPGSMWYSVSNEAMWFAEQGFYPKLTYQPTKPKGKFPKKYICVHFRNIRKGPYDNEIRNVPEILVSKILSLTKTYGFPILIVGNDKKYEYIEKEIQEDEQIIDVRGIIALPRLAWLLRESLLFIGQDSGIAHLAAIAGSPRLVCWNYAVPNWFPKCPKERYIAMVRSESTWENIKGAIDAKRLEFSR